MAVKFLDLTGLQKFWTKCKNAFVAKDANGNASVAHLSVDGELDVNYRASFHGDTDITNGSKLYLRNEGDTKAAALCCDDNGKLLLENVAVATVNDVATAIANAPHLKREKVTTLPGVASAQENVIYMLPVSGTSGDDTYDEYMLIEGKLEKMGSSRVDLSQYSTTSQMNSAISTAISNAHTAITETEINNLT